MLTRPTFDWSNEVEIDKELFCPDGLGRGKYAEFLTSYLYGQSQERPYVLNLNSGWGTGKTYFLKRWKHDLDKRHPVIYIDAWRDDHSDDPFLSVVSSIISQLKSKTDKSDESTLAKSFDYSARLAKQVAPIVIGGLVKKYIGVSLDSISQGNDDKPSSSNIQIDQVAQKISTLLLSEHEKRSSSITALKKTIEMWIGAVIGQNSSGDKKVEAPTFVIIDELDRCRPDYAVKTLEVVKHIFDIPGVFFIIATDTEQLQHAIKVVYGNDFNAHVYLSRFFDTRFSLQQGSLIAIIQAYCKDIKVFDKKYQEDNAIILWPPSQDDIYNIVAVIDSFKLSVRDALQIVNRISSILLFIGQAVQVDILYLTTLLCLQSSDYNSYLNFIGTHKIGMLDKVSIEHRWLNSSILISFNYKHPRNGNGDVIDVIKREIPIKDYYSNTFAIYSEIIDFITYDDGLASSDNKRLIFNKIIEDASLADRPTISPSYSSAWLRYTYLDFKLDHVERKKYIDMVEMAISFD